MIALRLCRYPLLEDLSRFRELNEPSAVQDTWNDRRRRFERIHPLNRKVPIRRTVPRALVEIAVLVGRRRETPLAPQVEWVQLCAIPRW
ncbi:hypothetical protein SUDANB95_02572 [Actinosynnema sp. ALI-1.44]